MDSKTTKKMKRRRNIQLRNWREREKEQQCQRREHEETKDKEGSCGGTLVKCSAENGVLFKIILSQDIIYL